MRAKRAVARADYVRMEQGSDSDADSEEYEPPVHPEFLGKRLQEAAAGAAATSATPPDALTKAWPRGGAPLTAPLLLAAAPVVDVTAGDAGTAIGVDLRPRLPPGAAVTLDGLAEALGWDAQVQTSSAAATQQAGVTLREWQAYAAAHAAAAKATARVAPAAPQPPRQLKRLRKAGQDIGGDGGGRCTAPGGGAVTASTNLDAADAATDGDAETAPASRPTDGQPETAANTTMPDAAPEGGPEAETAAVDQKPEPDAGAERQLPTQSEEQPPELSSELALQAIIMLPPQVGLWPPPAVLADSACPPEAGAGPHESLQPSAAAVLACAGAAANFQADPFGAATWWQQASGRRLLLAAPPSVGNLAAFEAWRRLRGPHDAATFLADRLQGLSAIALRPGQTAFLPGGWLTAHVSLSEGVAVTGRWLQRCAVAPQIASWQHAENAPPEHADAFHGFLWRVALAAASHLQVAAGLSDDALAAQVAELVAERAHAEELAAERAARREAQRQQREARRAAERAAAPELPPPACLAAGLGDDEDIDDLLPAEAAPEAAGGLRARLGSSGTAAAAEPDPPLGSLRRGHRRKATHPKAADDATPATTAKGRPPPGAVLGSGGGSGGLVGSGGLGVGAPPGTQPRLRIKLGSSGELRAGAGAAATAAAAAAAAPAAADPAGSRRPAAGRVVTKSGRSAGRAYTRADADASDSEDAEPLPRNGRGGGGASGSSGAGIGRGGGGGAGRGSGRLRIRLGALPGPGQVLTKSGRVAGRAFTRADAVPLSSSSGSEDEGAAAVRAPRIKLRRGGIPQVDGAADDSEEDDLPAAKQAAERGGAGALAVAAAAQRVGMADAGAPQQPVAAREMPEPSTTQQSRAAQPQQPAGAGPPAQVHMSGNLAAPLARLPAFATASASVAESGQPAEAAGQTAGAGNTPATAASVPKQPAAAPQQTDSSATPQQAGGSPQSGNGGSPVWPPMQGAKPPPDTSPPLVQNAKPPPAAGASPQRFLAPALQKGSLMQWKAAEDIAIVATGKRTGQTQRPVLRRGLTGVTAAMARPPATAAAVTPGKADGAAEPAQRASPLAAATHLEASAPGQPSVLLPAPAPATKADAGPVGPASGVPAPPPAAGTAPAASAAAPAAESCGNTEQFSEAGQPPAALGGASPEAGTIAAAIAGTAEAPAGEAPQPRQQPNGLDLQAVALAAASPAGQEASADGMQQHERQPATESPMAQAPPAAAAAAAAPQPATAAAAAEPRAAAPVAAAGLAALAGASEGMQPSPHSEPDGRTVEHPEDPDAATEMQTDEKAPVAAAVKPEAPQPDWRPAGDGAAYTRDGAGLAALLAALRAALQRGGAAAAPAFVPEPQRLLDELEVCIAAAGVGRAGSVPATPDAGRRRGHTAAGAAAAAQPVQLAAGAAGNGAPRTLLSDNDYKPLAEPESSGGSLSSGGAFAPRTGPGGGPWGLKRRAPSGPLSPEGAEEAGDSVAEARARGSKAMGPGRHAGLLTVAAVGAAGKKLSVKGRLMKKLRLG